MIRLAIVESLIGYLGSIIIKAWISEHGGIYRLGFWLAYVSHHDIRATSVYDPPCLI